MKNFEQKISDLKKEFLEQLTKISSEEELENLRVSYLSRNGEIAKLMHIIKELSSEEKKIFGPQLNELKKTAELEFETKKQKLIQQKLQAQEIKKQNFDVTSYLPLQPKGTIHPITQIIEKLQNIFMSMGYAIVDGPEIEDDFHNFQALNIPKDHPARDMQDTFWLTLPERLVRTHTSTIQIRSMEKQKPPLAIFASGRCYRKEATDATHDFVFGQCEALFIDKNLSMSNLFATIETSLKAIFEKDELNIRVRPGYFPFVEPGVEVDMQCIFCTPSSTKCSVCKGSRWIEITGAGMVHPNVLKHCNVDPNIYSGFAFAFGTTRITMLKHGINDIRLFNSGKIDFLEQF